MRLLACFLGMALLAIPACGLSTEGTADVAADGSAVDGTSPGDARPPVDGTTADATKPDGSVVREGGPDAPPPVDAPSDTPVDGPADAPIDALPDAPADAPRDARPDAPPPPPDAGMDACVPSGPEVCTDNIDNDCNGLVDCADPACATQGYACIPPPPGGGWSYGTVDLTGRPACPAGAGAAVGLVLDPVNNPASCTCGCSATQSPSCTMGTLAAVYGNDSMCSNGPDPYPVNGGACTNLASVGILAYVGAPPLPPTGPAACGAMSSTMVPPNGATMGEACPVAGPFGGGCTGGNVCGLVGPSPLRACVIHGGSAVCPAGYQVPHAAGASLTDARGCTACGCSTPPVVSCTGATWTFYQGSNCTGAGPDVLTINGGCDVSNADSFATYRSYQYAANVNVNCGVPTQQSGPTGSLTLNNPSTVCCAQ
jgi:hypothetical protein